MNGRKARALREEAIDLVGWTPRKLVMQKQKTTRGYWAERIVNHAGTVRATYQKLKRRAKR